MKRLAAAVAATLLLAAAPPPRQTAGQIASAVEEHYFDPAKAKEIADGLRAKSDSGAFDTLSDPQDLAHALTAYLSPFDGHFRVEWDGGAAPDESGPPPVPRLDYGDQLRRSNFGFRKVEILPGNVGLIDMRGFADFDPAKADEPALLAVNGALQAVAHADAVIIDLRQNGGGSPAMVGYLASAFLKPGTDVYNVFHTREGTSSEAPAVAYANPRTDVPVYILISARTGSAAEAFPYTLQAAKRATIIGEASAGAANPGGSVPTPSGFFVFVSTGTPVNPVTGGNWEGTGVKPDIEIPAAEAQSKAYELALEAVTALKLPDAEAVEARWVLESLKANAPAFTAADYLGHYDDIEISDRSGTLTLQRGRRPAVALKPLAADLFFVESDPTRRVVFTRDASGKVTTMDMTTSSGDISRLHRS